MKMIDLASSFIHEREKPKTNPPIRRYKVREDGIYIHKDNSEKTYEYEIVKDNEVILMGDAFETPEEIIDWFNDIANVVNNGKQIIER